MRLQFNLSVLCLLVLLGACSGETPQTATVLDTAPVTNASSTFAQVDQQRIIADEAGGENWLSYGRSYNEQRFSPLDQINADTIDRLGLAWYADFETSRNQQSTPVVADGVIYVTEVMDIVHAYDARTGTELWKYDPQMPGDWLVNACCDAVNRGVALWEGKVIFATTDNRLIALNAENGALIWSTQTTPIDQPYATTGAPRIAKGKVFMGNGGAEFGVRGFVAAYDVNTGERDWIWYTVPGNPAEGFENPEMEMAAATWNGEWWLTGGGGTVWDAMTYDPVTDLLLIGTGNGSPWPSEIRSPGGGDNLFLASIVALDPDTGDYVWHYQMTPADSWDYNAAQQIVIADIEIDGEMRHVAMQQPKNGFFYMLDVATGELLSAEMVIPVTWAEGVDMDTGRPIENPAARYDRTGEGMVVTPWFNGSHAWHPMSYNPNTGLVYIPIEHRNWGFIATREDDNPMGMKLSMSLSRGPELHDTLDIPLVHETFLLAWDPVEQREVWRVPHGNQLSGGTLSTQANLVFQGNRNDNHFYAFDAATGERLWAFDVQTGALAGPVTYSVDGEQYVAVVGGYKNTGSYYEPNGSRLLVFKLDGSAQLPPEVDYPDPVLNPPEDFGSEEQLALGLEHHDNFCGGCHGTEGQARTFFPDLRYSAALNTQEAFDAIVLDGVRSERGMVSFAQVLSPEDAVALRAYITRRSNELQESQASP